ncbi:MAG: NAD synthetase [Parcubacteria group bacterium GW2011_GWA2_47_10]|nr:MAG: NAD synthetase [Parcubacteria group bacterium GW2011_GWA2_47_10]OGZ99677.1 MAG: NAD(+) synthase [Candidatus Sungbacteria bacterium RIFCSPHIGHO2_02_FULL_46_12]
MTTSKKTEQAGYARVAAIVPRLRVGDPAYNAGEILAWLRKADREGVAVAVFPEMSLPGYTVADLYFQKLLERSIEGNLLKLVAASRTILSVFLVGLPLHAEGKIFNVAAVIGQGKLYGFVPKTHIPNYKEFYEKRWFSSSRDLAAKEVTIGGRVVPIGTDLLFRVPSIKDLVLGVEICEDVWAPLPPSSFQVLCGATVIANLSASNELVGKAEYRRTLIVQQSARGASGYVYASSGVHESTTDVVFGGHAMIAENGGLLAESRRFERNGEMIISDIDLEHITGDRERITTFGTSIHESYKKDFRFIDVDVKPTAASRLYRAVEQFPFVPHNAEERDMRAAEIFSIQVAGLAKRLEFGQISDMVIGLSGGLDSTLAILVGVKTAEALGLPKKRIHAFSMPGFGTTGRTRGNAQKLAEALGVSFEEIDITKGVTQQFKDIRHDGKTDDVVYENAQARYRTMTLMQKANQLHGVVLGTGDLSEIALGWNTYTGDHIAHYNVNCSVPKTLVSYLVKWVAETQVGEKEKKILFDIIATPISPELKKTRKGTVTQKTEEIIGPYELHDFFLYHFVRWGSSPKKILKLAELAWGKKYSKEELKKCLGVFITRFFNSQWKRSVATDGPKVGSVSLSPRGDWRMPSDGDMKLWLEDLKD